MKFLWFLISALSTWVTCFLMGASIAAHNATGMFWYGIMLIVSGVSLKLSMKEGGDSDETD
jgi:hypothetical protein